MYLATGVSRMSSQKDSSASTPTPQATPKPSPQGPKPSVPKDDARTLKAMQSYVEEQRAKDTLRMEEMLQRQAESQSH